jgi:N-acetylmuramoyl-L-alanine amidase
MKIGIDIGHNCPPDIGAKGIRFEDNLTLEVGTKVIEKLRSLGHTVISCKPDHASTVRESLAKRCEKANSNNVDTYVSIHFNYFNGQANGTEVYATSDAGRKIAQSVLSEIVKLEFFNRGVKNGSHLFVLKNTHMPGILIECCFVDSSRDMQLYNGEALANAIVEGLTGKVSTKVSSAPVNTVPDEEHNADNSILRLQHSLNRLKISGNDGHALKEDNKMGPATTAAIEEFQKIVGVLQTGIAGNTTWNVLNQILAKRVIQGTHATGASVRYIQYRVGAAIDGIYGAHTMALVKKFQHQHGLTADGIVGAMTWQKLIG